MQFEQLESRRLMSVSLSGGVLTLTGDNAAQTMRVDVSGTNLVANDGLGTVHTAAISAVNSIVVNALGGNDKVLISSAVTKPTALDGGAGNDTVQGGNGRDNILGGAGDDTLRGQAGNDTIQGLSGTDTISGGSGDDLLDGGRLGNFPADDTGDDKLFGDTGKDTLHASDHGNNTLDGGTNDDRLFGYGGTDTLRGGDGNDSLNGGTGADAMWGGNGTDTVDYGGLTGLHTISLDDVANDGWFAFFAAEGDNTHSDIENVIGSEGNDVIRGSGAANVLDGRGGNDEIRGQGGDDRVLGGNGNDKLFGGFGRDVYQGGAGNDVLDAGNESTTEGDDFSGGSGADTITYASRSVGVRVQLDDLANDGFTDGTHGAGVELDNVRSDIETVIGTSGSDGLYGNAFANRLIGGGGGDYIAGGAGDDTLEGGDGDDILIGEAGIDRLLGGNGNDTLWARDGSVFDTVDGGAGYDRAQIDRLAIFLSDSATNVEAWF